ncbi:MAG: oligosaccharide flippase family protein [Deltaproteobacteria bacterium]|nr:oligosaccharide flippase family protein [Deltaproteobacteria bacterium]
MQAGVLFNLLGKASVVASGGLVSIILARHYGKVVFGQWAAAIVYGTLVGTIIEGGLSRVLLRDASRDPSRAGKALGAILKGRLSLAALALPLAYLAAWKLSPNRAVLILSLFAATTRCLAGLFGSYSTVLFALDHHRLPNIVETVQRIAIFLSVVIATQLDQSIYVVATYVLIIGLLSAAALRVGGKRVVTADFSGSPLQDWRDAAWFWLNGVLFWINGEVDQLMLSHMHGDSETGIYAAAVRLGALFLILPRALGTAIMPRLFRSAVDGKGLQRQLNSSVFILSMVGGAVAAELAFSSDIIIDLIYRRDFSAAAPVLSLIGLYLLLNFLRLIPSWFLSASDRVPMMTIVLIIGAGANIISNWFVIPRYGAIGAAASTVGSEALMLIGATILAISAAGPRMIVAAVLGLVPGLLVLATHLALAGHLPTWFTTGLTGVLCGGAIGWTLLRMRRGWNPFGLFPAK